MSSVPLQTLLKTWKPFFSLCWRWLLVRKCLAMAGTRRWTSWAKMYPAKTRKRKTTPELSSLLTTVSQTAAFTWSERPIALSQTPWDICVCTFVFLQVWRRFSRCVVRCPNCQTSCLWQKTHSWLPACSSTSSMTTFHVIQREPTSETFVMNILSTFIK